MHSFYRATGKELVGDRPVLSWVPWEQTLKWKFSCMDQHEEA